VGLTQGGIIFSSLLSDTNSPAGKGSTFCQMLRPLPLQQAPANLSFCRMWGPATAAGLQVRGSGSSPGQEQDPQFLSGAWGIVPEPLNWTWLGPNPFLGTLGLPLSSPHLLFLTVPCPSISQPVYFSL
jgi:hypothetical protein